MCASEMGFRLYLEGQGDLVSRLITAITQIVPLTIRILTYLLRSPP